MLRSIENLQDYKIQAADGEIGKISSLIFNEKHWRIRYLVIDVGSWLMGRQVLIPPTAVLDIDSSNHKLFLSLTKSQIENSPNVAEDAPISREIEAALHKYYQWRPYWGVINDPLAFGAHLRNPAVMEKDANQDETKDNGLDLENHLRSTSEVTGYHIQAIDGEIGHINDFLFDDKEWRIRHLVVDTGNWLPGKKVLLAPPWIQRIQWAAQKVHFALSKDSVQHSPPFDSSFLDTDDYEEAMLDHYQGWFSYLLNKKEGDANMFLGKDIMGNSVITVSNGRSIGKVRDIYLTPDCQEVAGIYLGTEGLFSRQSLLIDNEDVITFGEDAILVKDDEVIEEMSTFPESENSWLRRDELQGRPVDTPGGTKVGKIGDVILNREGNVEGFSLSHVYVAGPVADNHAIAMHTVRNVGQEDGKITIDLKQAEIQELSVA